MPTLANPQQIINGKQFDYSSIEIVVDKVPHAGVKSISYSHQLDPGEGRGTRSQIVLRSRGKYSAEGSIEIYKYEFQTIISALGALGVRGFMEYAFDINIHYSELGMPMITDNLLGCRIKKAADSPGEDGGLLTVKCDLHILQVIPGVPGANTPLFAVEPTKFLK